MEPNAKFLVLWALCGYVALCSSKVLTPPYFNLAEGRRITASSTCGEDIDERELFCKLVGANSDKSADFSVIQGQLCDYCEPLNRKHQHPPEFAIDGSERWWQSPPLSRGMNYNKVNLTIDLGQLFQVAYVIIKMGNSPRPGIWVLERSVDNGESYTPWQYFADNVGDCEHYFGRQSIKGITNDDDVVCTTQFSKVVPLEGGEIVVSLLNDRPSAKNFFNSTVLQEFTRATNVRLRLLRTKTLLGHLMSVARRDPTVTRRYFYSIKDISIGGRCVCNGHASICDIADPNDPYKLQCRCQHNTCGHKCEECCPGFIQKKWRPASHTQFFICETCNCYGHTNECTYDEEVDARMESLDIYGKYEGGGVCHNCQHNTEGINCNKCKQSYYRPYGKKLNDTDVCWPCQCPGRFYTGNCADETGQCECRPEFLPPLCDACNDGYYDYPNCKPCDCHREGTAGGVCEVGGGQCPCIFNFVGLNCDQCAPGYYNFPECVPCNCNTQGSLDNYCDINTGQCSCHNNYGGRECSRCEHGYYDFRNNCTFCNCDAQGSQITICDKDTGECLCEEGFSSNRCDTNAPGFWGYPLVKYCSCHESGSSSTICDVTGRCPCITGYSGRTCDQCSPGYFDFPNCKPCNCDNAGSIGASCDSEGRCQCKYNFDGIHCDICRDEFYNFPLCEECNCDPAGVLETFAGCGNAPVGELCECKERAGGRICNDCKSLFWNLQQSNPLGCEECSCNIPGTIGALTTCNSKSGQCVCKPHVVSRRCDECKDGTFNLMEDNLFGCEDCRCNIGGSESSICDKQTGKCQCKQRIQGQRCDQPMKLHYFPTLYQLKYEAEEGKTAENTPVRFGYDEAMFPGYSWRGYAVYSELQKQTIYDIYIRTPTLYRLVFYYRNPTSQSIKGKVTITPEDPKDVVQTLEVNFKPTNGPELMTASTGPGVPSPLVINPGVWLLAIEAKDGLYLDYFVLLPSAYYEAAILSETVSYRCQIRGRDDMCLHYAYPSVDNYDAVFGVAGYIDSNGTREAVEILGDEEIISYLGTRDMAWLSNNQPKIQYDLRIGRPGQYVILLNYFTPEGSRATNVMVSANTQDDRQNGRAVFYDCTFTWLCRQIVTNFQGEVAVFNFNSNFIKIILEVQGDSGGDIGFHSVSLVPYEEWHMDMVVPKSVCTRKGGECLQSTYPSPPESTKVEFETNLEGKVAPHGPGGLPEEIQLVYLNGSDKMVDLSGKLRSEGAYVFVIHYYQPNHPKFTLNSLMQNGKFYEAQLPLEYCPNRHGCRAILEQIHDGSTVFKVLENFILSLTLNSPGKDVWLDYLLVIPAEQYSERFTREEPRDKTAEFFEKCGQNHFHIDPSESGFCRDAAFTLTSEFNYGALQCQCNPKGSRSFECDVFGGQCDCKPNVIGRQCSLCKTGYFGFPNCRPCDCPSTALCDPYNGECICPPRVVGERCESCAPNTYGFDPIIGCEQCRCNELGVKRGQMQCDLTTGQCDCNDKVIGRRCDRCDAGYWAFPYCQLCNCDLRGTEDDICNQNDATCFCKLNTEGPACEVCVRGTYHLEETNPDGCTKCFCFGKSQTCSSSTSFISSVATLQGWKSAEIELSEDGVDNLGESVTPTEYADLIQLDFSTNPNPGGEGTVYFSAPVEFLGNKIKSYGTLFEFKLLAISNQAFSPEVTRDVILDGNNITAFYTFYEDPVQNGQNKEFSIKLIERNFETFSGQHLKREQFMMMLHNLQGIYIRAHYSSEPLEARLSDVKMEMATRETQTDDFRQALSIEQCQCPPNYAGSSCEDCAKGYYRTQAGPYGGYCVPCQCNNHANECDPLTGICLNCQDNTIGEHCENCAAGYFGDPTRGTQVDCLICSCPLPSITNNFALSCKHDFTFGYEEELFCECKPGYTGKKCEACAPGFYGQPFLQGDYCKSCECNDNIDVLSPYSCDNINGICLECLNNSYGPHCERCAPGYYGDAIVVKNCQECSCDECGTYNCQHTTGICECFPQVIGDKCDKCAPDHWGFASCQGCYACDCGEASESSQCDEETGQCICRPGVTGKHCDRCSPGFWDYTTYGCKECECKEGFSVGVGCDPNTGQCSCLPGVIGDNCEGCPHRWILIEGIGCKECDDCVHALLDSAEELHSLIQPVIGEFETAAQSFFLQQRLQIFNDSIIRLTPKIQDLDFSEEKLQPVKGALQDLEENTLAVSTKTKVVHQSASDSSYNGNELQKQADEVLEKVLEGAVLAREVVQEINLLVIGLETGTGARIELAIQEAEAIVKDMETVDMGSESDKADADFEIASEFLERINNLSIPVKQNKELLEDSAARLNDLEDRLKDLHGYIRTGQDQSHDIQAMNQRSKVYGLGNLRQKYEETSRLRDETEDRITDATNYTNTAAANLATARINYQEIASDLDSLREANDNLNSSVIGLSEELIYLYEPAGNAIDHAEELRTRADQLDNLLADTRDVTEKGLDAAHAYDNIVLAIEEADMAARAALNASNKAVELSSGITDQALNSRKASEKKHQESAYTTTQVDNILHPQLIEAKGKVSSLQTVNEIVENTLDRIDNKLGSISKDSIEAEAIGLHDEATNAENEAVIVNEQVNSRYEQLQRYRDEARQYSENIEQAKRDSKLAFEQLNIVEDLLPRMEHSAEELLEEKSRIQNKLQDVEDRLARLRRTITKTREQTNKIKVGVEFEPGTVLELKKPEDLSDFATATEISFFIKTREPSGLPFFLGTPVGVNNQLQDFIAVEIKGGYVRLITNLGSEANTLVNNKYVADGKWHKVVINRIGKLIKLSVISEDKDRNEEVEEIEKVLPGTYSILNLDQKLSKLYVGGILPGVDVDQSIETIYFIGQMEDLWINKRPIGFWNFVRRAQEYPLNGALERDILKKLTSEGLRFDGTGYVSLDTKNLQIYESFSIRFSFKTFVEDGILFILENGVDEYVSIELRDGKVSYQHKFRAGHVSLVSDGKYNDNEWHTIEATKAYGDAIIKVDGGDEKQGGSPGSQNDFSQIPEVVYFGGYPGDHMFSEIINEDFRGCIENVEIAGQTIDFLKSKDSIGTVPGCPLQVANLVSFFKGDPGFVKLPSPEGKGLQLVFKFRTQNPNGLLFYTETSDRSIYLSLSLAEGALVLRSAPGGEITTGSLTEYNDSAWHFVIATREANMLRLDIDDFEQFSVELIQESIPFNGPVFFGGIPNFYHIEAAAAAVDTNFFGCIGDVTLNGHIVDFATAPKADRPGAMLDMCSLTKEIKSKTVIPESTFAETTTQPLDQCALPIDPETDEDIGPENGVRFVDSKEELLFGHKRDSRIEYNSLPDDIRLEFTLSFDFKTEATEGIMFYTSNINHRDFAAIFMKDGKIVFSFNAGTGPALIRTRYTYNDNQWYKLEVRREGTAGKIYINGYLVANGTSHGIGKHIEHVPPYYFGGVNQSIADLAAEKMERTDLSFNGCLRGFRMNNQVVGGSRNVVGVHKCSYKVEQGVFFGMGQRSHIVVRPRFNVGIQFQMSLEIKPRRNSGVIMSIHGRRDLVLLQLNNGDVEFKIDNGKGIATTSFSLSNQFQICDGRWHTIQILKNKNLAILIVDGVSAAPASGPAGTNSADTNNPLFLGSQPRLGRRRGDAVKEKYVGCMRNLVLQEEPVDLSYTLFVGNVTAGVCPLI